MESSQTGSAPRKRFSPVIFVLAVFGAALVIGLTLVILNSGPTQLQDAVVARGFDDATGPTGVGTTFSPQDNPLHCVVTVVRASKGTKLEITWIAISAGGQHNYTLLDRNLELDGHQSTVDAYLTLPDLWLPGEYKIDIRLDAQLSRTLFFTIEDKVKVGAGAYLLQSF